MTLQLKDQRFGRLIAKRRTESHISPNGRKHARWECVCDCGQILDVLAVSLKSGDTRSCGCLAAELSGKRLRLLPRTPSRLVGKNREYRIWKNIIQRCTNPRNPSYLYYGGRGIRICAQWRGSFDQFYVDVGPIPVGLEIDRYPNNDGNYEPGNVRITNRSNNMKNSRLGWRKRNRNLLGQFQ